MEDIVYWLALSEAPLPLDFTLTYYWDYGALEGLWDVPADYLRAQGLSSAIVSRFIMYRSKMNITKYNQLINVLKHRRVKVLRIIDESYPSQLKSTKESKSRLPPPLILFHQGELTKFERCLAVVGTRECSHYGNMMAREIARELARKGYTIVSGLARGVDTEAHCGALDIGRKTIAVLAWLEPIYPPENKRLLNDIVRSGATLSERYFQPQGKVSHLFVERNRITSGLSSAIIIIESGEEGGTTWQFDLAKEQGKPVFVMKPKEYDSFAIRGYKYFMSKGAKSFDSIQELISELEMQLAFI